MPDKETAQWIMTASVAHHLTSAFCGNQAFEEEKKEKNSDFAYYFTVVALELALLSIEQSLKLILFLQFSIPLKKLNSHNLLFLYEKIEKEGESGRNLCDKIIQKIDFYAREKDFNPICEEDLKTCLKKHTDTYKKIRYLFVDLQGIQDYSGIPRSDAQIIECLRQSLVHLNINELNKREIKHPVVGVD